MMRISKPFNGKNYWQKKGYNLLDGAVETKRNIQVVRLKGSSRSSSSSSTTRKKRFVWRTRKSTRVCLKGVISSPVKLWSKFKNGYINMMLRLAGDVGKINGGSDFERKRISQARNVQVKYKSKDEFEARLVLEIYKALSTSKGLSEIA